MGIVCENCGLQRGTVKRAKLNLRMCVLLVSAAKEPEASEVQPYCWHKTAVQCEKWHKQEAGRASLDRSRNVPGGDGR